MIETDGIDALLRDLMGVAVLPDSVAAEMLEAEAKVVVKSQQDSARKAGLVDTGKMIESIRPGKTVKASDGTYLDVYPQGTHHTYRSRDSGKKAVRNAEVAYVHEFGAPQRGIKATEFISKANAAAADEATAAAAEVLDKFLKSNNL